MPTEKEIIELSLIEYAELIGQDEYYVLPDDDIFLENKKVIMALINKFIYIRAATKEIPESLDHTISEAGQLYWDLTEKYRNGAVVTAYYRGEPVVENDFIEEITPVNKVFNELCLKYPALVYSFYKNSKTSSNYNKQLIKNQVVGDITKEELQKKIDEGYRPVISAKRIGLIEEWYEHDKNLFSQYIDFKEDWNKYAEFSKKYE